MEEELNENELDERFYSLIHYADDGQENLNVNQKDVLQTVENRPRSTVRRYWRTSEEHSVYQKVNTPKVPPANKSAVIENTDSKSKPDKRDAVSSTQSTNLLSMFQTPVSQNLKKTVEIIESDFIDPQIVSLESSDEDEVIEIALPPKPTITIESSDEDEVCAIKDDKPHNIVTETTSQEKKTPCDDRDVSASPVPSIVSSVSDDFIRGDCIALNISSRHPNNQSFDFSLHGSDLLVQKPSKKKKKKKNKDANITTPITSTPVSDTSTATGKEECFATPKSKAKNKRHKNKSYLVSAKSLPNPDVYDSDSNQSGTEINKNPPNSECVKSTDISQPMSDLPEILNTNQSVTVNNDEASEKNISKDNQENMNQKIPNLNDSSIVEVSTIVDLTEPSEQEKSLVSIDENILMGNVTGFSQLEKYDVNLSAGDAPKLGSTNVPAILFADLDFNNLNGKEKPAKKRRYSLTTLRAEMEKFYNESWGGENFNHREIQKYMSRDKNLWVIDPKDRISALSKRKVTCNYCNRSGHRGDTCRLKPPVCYMCGSMGHNEPRCPRKICVNCGSPNYMYSTMCRNCYQWNGITCAECGQRGHPASHCPDLWRRYHNTISEDTPLEENHQSKKHYQMFCSGCTRRGHLVHSCRSTVPFSGLPANSPYVIFYNPIYPPTNIHESESQQANQPTTDHKKAQQDDTITCVSNSLRTDCNKRQSKSPVAHETHVNKKRNLSGAEPTDTPVYTKGGINNSQKRKTSQTKDVAEEADSSNKDPIKIDPKTAISSEKAPDFIPLCSENHDKQGQIIQDNEVSDTSDIITSAKIYITGEIIDKLNTAEGLDWLNMAAEKNSVSIQKTDIISFLVIKGTVGNQDNFQAELRNWIKNKVNGEYPEYDKIGDSPLANDSALSNNIPKNRNNVLRVISKALDSLKEDIGDPKALFKELNFLQNRHLLLLKQKAISPKQLSNSRTNMNSIFRKLNMVLLGQAGLADGSQHLNELCTLQEKITNFRQKTLPPQLRQEIGQHFHRIFTSTPREDYAELLSKYYISRNTQLFSKNKKNVGLKLNPVQKQQVDMNHMLQDNCDIRMDVMGEDDIIDVKKHQTRRRPLVEKTVNKLVFYHRRLLNSKPIDAVLRKTRMALVNRLHAHIASVGKNRNVSTNTLKKMRKIQKHAQLFLNNV